MGEFDPLDSLLQTLKDIERLLGLEVPDDDGGLGHLAVNRTLLPRGNDPS